MKLTFLGTGSAFTTGGHNYHSNMIMTSDSGKHLLLDCGSDIRHSTHECKIGYKDIDAVFISHFHADHCGGLEWLGITTKVNPHCKRPILYLKNNMTERLWNNVLSGGMRTFEDEKTSLESFFKLTTIEDNNQFSWEGIVFTTVQTVHVIDNGELVPSYGLFFTIGKHNIFISFDTQFKPERYQQQYQQADLIFHECETRKKPTGVHSNYRQLITLPLEIRKKMWLYHYNPGKLPDAVKDGFCGFVKKGQSFNLTDPTIYPAK